MRLASRPPLARIAAIDREIRSGRGPNAFTLAKQLEVNHRTIQRDLCFLRDRLHAPITFDASRNGYYYTDASFRVSLFHLTEGELIAIFLAERVLQQYRGTPYAKALRAAFGKMTEALVDSVSIDLTHLDASLSFSQRAIEPGDSERFAKLTHAVQEGRQLDLVYWTASRDLEQRRVVDPYHLTSIDGDWFLIAYCHLREEVRMFSPQRIRQLRETGERFSRPADFRIADYLDVGFRKLRGTGAPQSVWLRFSPDASKYVKEKTWHPTQQLAAEADGRLVLTFQVNHLLEVKRWVLSFGADCQVLEPEELRDEIAKEVGKLAAQRVANDRQRT